MSRQLSAKGLRTGFLIVDSADVELALGEKCLINHLPFSPADQASHDVGHEVSDQFGWKNITLSKVNFVYA